MRGVLPNEIKGLDCGALDPRLIAIADADAQAVVLDYRAADEPRVCLAFFSEQGCGPLHGWEQHEATLWWPNMAVFFRGPYRQDQLA